MTQSIAAVSRVPGRAPDLEPQDIGDPWPDEVRVRILASGVCHTDLSALDQSIPVQLPVVLGHEGAGIVDAVGPGVHALSPGDRVVLSYAACGTCSSCRRGRPAYCVHAYQLNLAGNRADGTSAFGGGIRSHFVGQSSFATHAVVPARHAIRVPDGPPLELLAPLGCGVQTGAGVVFNSLRVEATASLAVFGAGAVGLSAVMAGAVVGAEPIIAVDKIPSRLDLASRLGATHVINADTTDPVAAIRDLTHGGANYSVEAAGTPSTFSQAVHALGVLGVCGVVGAASSTTIAGCEWGHLLINGITIRGLLQGDSVPGDSIPHLIRLHAQGRFPFDEMVQFYDFADLGTALRDSREGRVVKPIVRMPAHPGVR